jgi:hypothetical protein
MFTSGGEFGPWGRNECLLCSLVDVSTWGRPFEWCGLVFRGSLSTRGSKRKIERYLVEGECCIILHGEDVFSESFALLLACLVASVRWAFCLCLEEPVLCSLLVQAVLFFTFVWFWTAWTCFFSPSFSVLRFSLVFDLFQVVLTMHSSRGRLRSQWTGLIAPGMMSDCQRHEDPDGLGQKPSDGLEALRWTGGRWWWSPPMDWGQARRRSAMGVRYTEGRLCDG